MRYLIVIVIVLTGLLSGVALAQEPEPSVISYGETVQGTISDHQPEQRYRFTAARGDEVYVSVSDLGTNLRIELTLKDEHGRVLQHEEEGYGTNTLVIGPFEIPIDGSYEIIIAGLRETTGNFMLTLGLTEVNALEIGSVVEGKIETALGMHFYEFIADADDVMHIEATGSGVRFILVGPDNETVSAAKFSNSPNDSFVVLPLDGIYQLIVQTQTFGGSAYTLTAGVYDVIDIEMAQSTAGVISPKTAQVFRFFPTTDDSLLRIAIISQVPGFDAGATVYDMSGDRKSSVPRASEEEIDLLLDPWIISESEYYYYILVRPDSDLTAEIPFEILVDTSHIEWLEADQPTTVVLGSSRRSVQLVMTDVAGAQATVSVKIIDGSCTPTLVIEEGDGDDLFKVSQNTVVTDFQATTRFTDVPYFLFKLGVGYSEDCVVELLVDTAN